MELYPSLEYQVKQQHQTVAHLVAPLTDTVLHRKPSPEKWSVYEQVAHLVRYQETFLERLHQIFTTETPAFARYVADDDDEFSKFLSQSSGSLLTQLDQKRQVIINQLLSLSPDQLVRTGVHPKFGELNIVEWTEFFIFHEAHHIYTIFQLIHACSQNDAGPSAL